MNKIEGLFVSTAAFLALSSPAAAGWVTYSDFDTWIAQTELDAIIDFSSFELDYGKHVRLAASGSTAGVLLETFGTANKMQIVNPPRASPRFIAAGYGEMLAALGGRAGNYLQITPPGDVTALGFLIAGVHNPVQNFLVDLGGNQILELISTQIRPDWTFFGVRSSEPLGTIKLIKQSNHRADFAIVDNIMFGRAGMSGVEVAEVSASLYIVTGVLILGLARLFTGPETRKQNRYRKGAPQGPAS